MRIERMSVWQVALPLRTPFITAATSLAERRVVLVRIDAEGLCGWGEAAPVPGYSTETVDAVWAALAGGGGLLATHVDADLGARPDLPPSARAALAGALADLRARRDGLPLWRALGGIRSQVPGGAVAGLAGSVAETAAEVDRHVAAGYRAVKLKIAPGADRDRLAAVRRDHPALVLGADGNGGYGRDDLATLASLDEFGLLYLEQPLPAEDLHGHAELAVLATTPVCLDESLAVVADVRTAAAQGAAALVNVKPGRVGGLDLAVAMLEAVTGAGLGARIGGMLETGVGRSHLVALATLPGVDVVGDVSAPEQYLAADFVDPRWRLVDGCFPAPGAAGIGVAVDEQAVERHAERSGVYR